MVQLDNKTYLRQSERVIEFIHQRERENVGKLIMIHIVVANNTDWVNLREFRLVLWTKLEMSRYAAKIGMLQSGSVAIIENAENTYAIRCCKEYQVEYIEIPTKHHLNLSFTVQI